MRQIKKVHFILLLYHSRYGVKVLQVFVEMTQKKSYSYYSELFKFYCKVPALTIVSIANESYTNVSKSSS